MRLYRKEKKKNSSTTQGNCSPLNWIQAWSQNLVNTSCFYVIHIILFYMPYYMVYHHIGK